MVDILVAKRIEDPLSDVETIIKDGYFQIRPSVPYAANGQWVDDAWSQPINMTGSALTFKLDPLADVPYELFWHYTDGRNQIKEGSEFRYVTASGTPLKWEDLERTGGVGTQPAVPSDVEAQVAALAAQVATLAQAVANVSGGASNLSAISGISTDGKALIATPNTNAQMRVLLGAAATSHAHVPTTDLTATGTPDGTKFLAGDNTWKTPTGVVAGSVAWADITSKPTTFAPSTHAHAVGDVTGLQTALDALGEGVTTAQATADAAVDTADIGSILSDALAPYVTTTQLTAALANVPYLLSYNGTAWPVARPAGAGTRTVMALGAPVAPTWLDTARDFWVGTVA